MKSRNIAIAISLVLTLAACRKSEVDQKPAATVNDAPATAAADTSTAPAPGGVQSKVIREKSSIEFVAAKVTRDHKGKFNDFDGSIEYVDKKPSRIAFEIDMNSIETDTEKLTGHLKTPDFFDVAKYPKATFTSSSLTDSGGGKYELKGTLDMHGVQKEVTIPVTAAVSPEGVRTTSEFTINRQDWNIAYKGAPDDLIKDNVLIKLNLLFPPPPV